MQKAKHPQVHANEPEAPVKLNAQAKSGWHFDHWEGVKGDNTQSEIKAKVNGDMNIKAVFEKDIV